MLNRKPTVRQPILTQLIGGNRYHNLQLKISSRNSFSWSGTSAIAYGIFGWTNMRRKVGKWNLRYRQFICSTSGRFVGLPKCTDLLQLHPNSTLLFSDKLLLHLVHYRCCEYCYQWCSFYCPNFALGDKNAQPQSATVQQRSLHEMTIS